ncbi:MAG: nucleoside hydrolase [Erysipelotrichaceae bacterium]|jgi:inosine-uridine nucleoside N-ribohydrolase|nr:nucleoside hydrolase [Erysipelotrichaceae bacterium]
MPRKIILDVDTGSDDAVAIMTAILAQDIELLAVCTVAGNLDIDKTTENTLRVVEALDPSVPVYRGCAVPLVKNLVPTRIAPSFRVAAVVDGKEVHIHEDEVPLPKATIKEQRLPAPAYYVETLREAKEPLTLVAVGPLTNLGAAFAIDPGIAKNIEEIVVMGGGDRITNATANAEFNIWADPEAANWVLKCGAKTTWIPLDATHAAYLTMDDCASFRALHTLAGNFAADLIEHRIIVHDAAQPLEVKNSAAVHDALAVCYLIDPKVIINLKEVHLEIGIGDYGEGRTFVDPRYYPDTLNARFAFSGDSRRFAGLLTKIFAKGPKA